MFNKRLAEKKGSKRQRSTHKGSSKTNNKQQQSWQHTVERHVEAAARNREEQQTNDHRRRPSDQQQQARTLTIRRKHINNAHNGYQLLRDNNKREETITKITEIIKLIFLKFNRRTREERHWNGRATSLIKVRRNRDGTLPRALTWPQERKEEHLRVRSLSRTGSRKIRRFFWKKRQFLD